MPLGSIRQTLCPACANHVAVLLYSGGENPLATLAWPRTEDEARNLPGYQLDFVRCVHCGHIYNPTFCYDNVPYLEKPNLMFNKGKAWSEFIQCIQKRILEMLPESPTIVEVGHGDGSFLHGLSQLVPDAELIGFDPHGARQTPDAIGGIDLRNELFIPEEHLDLLRPHMIISRHVLEHLVNPVAFLQRLAFCASLLDQTVQAYFEVPCVDNMLTSKRTVDLYYEHSSQFTTTSFTMMLQRCGAEMMHMEHGYDGEVIYAFIRLGNGRHSVEIAQDSAAFHQATQDSQRTITAQLADLATSSKTVAIWGGTGKSAAFMHRYNCDAKRFPLVVDSDPDKVNTYVPGTGQMIRFRDYLKDHPAQVIIIPPQWRARDILLEMGQEGIACETVLVEDQGRLVEYWPGQDTTDKKLTINRKGF